MRVRDAGAADLPRLTAIYEHAVLHGTATYELDPPSLDEMGRRLSASTAGGYPWLVAEEDGQVGGYAYAGPFRPRPAYRFIVENSVYLDPAAQGRGLGRVLMQALIARCRDAGFRQIIAVIGDGHAASASVKLHERLGFAHSGVMRASGWKDERWLDTVFMQLPLNGGGETPPDPQSLPERMYRQALT